MCSHARLRACRPANTVARQRWSGGGEARGDRAPALPATKTRATAYHKYLSDTDFAGALQWRAAPAATAATTHVVPSPHECWNTPPLPPWNFRLASGAVL